MKKMIFLSCLICLSVLGFGQPTISSSKSKSKKASHSSGKNKIIKYKAILKSVEIKDDLLVLGLKCLGHTEVQPGMFADAGMEFEFSMTKLEVQYNIKDLKKGSIIVVTQVYDPAPGGIPLSTSIKPSTGK